MSSRLNPRKYDLRELRDAATETDPERPERRFEADASDDPEWVTACEGTFDGDRGHRDDQPRRADDASEDSGTTLVTDRRRDPAEDASGRLASLLGGERAESSTHSEPSQSEAVEDADPTESLETLALLDREDVERPYLSRLPDDADAQPVIFAWLQTMLECAGRESTLEALSYYESVEWLSESSRDELEAFLDGLAAEEPSEPRELALSDHRRSLRFVARLSALTGR